MVYYQSLQKDFYRRLPGGDLDFDFARREAAKAKRKQAKPKEERSILKGILDYLHGGDFDRDFAVREIKK